MKYLMPFLHSFGFASDRGDYPVGKVGGGGEWGGGGGGAKLTGCCVVQCHVLISH